MLIVPVLLTPSVFCISPTGDQLAVASGPQNVTSLAATLSEGFNVRIDRWMDRWVDELDRGVH